MAILRRKKLGDLKMNEETKYTAVIRNTQERIEYKGPGKYFWSNFEKTWKWHSKWRKESKQLTYKEFKDEDINRFSKIEEDDVVAEIHESITEYGWGDKN